MMLDAHILFGDEPTKWQNEALGDIDRLPIRLHTLPAVHGQLGAARKAGWSCGNAPFLTWLDPDDRYPPDAATFITQAQQWLHAFPSCAGVYSYEQRIDADGNPIGHIDSRPYSPAMLHAHPSWIHGLIILRRAGVAEHVAFINDSDPMPEWTLFRRMNQASHTFHRLPFVARRWRQHDGQAHRKAQEEGRRGGGRLTVCTHR